jgi:hypothetical protein
MKQRFFTVLQGLLFSVVLSALLISCGNETKNKEQKDEEVITEENVVEQAQKLVYPLPTPLEVTTMLNKAGANYILDLANRPENVDKYFTEMAKALNLGVYGADLSYASTYNKSQETHDYLACTLKLRDGLSVETPEDLNLLEKVEANINNNDSLYEILTTSFHGTFKYLNDNGKGAVSVMVLAGGWIEGVYLSVELASLTENNTEILKTIAEQKNTLDNLIPLLEAYKNDENVASVLKDLNEIRVIFDSIPAKEDGTINLNEENFKKIQTAIKALRKKVIETT